MRYVPDPTFDPLDERDKPTPFVLELLGFEHADDTLVKKIEQINAGMINCKNLVDACKVGTSGYNHISQAHCDGTCGEKSKFEAKFIGNCSEKEVEDMCTIAMKYDNCFAWQDGNQTVAFTTFTRGEVGYDRNHNCDSTKTVTVVFEKTRQFIHTMYPGSPDY